jgi:hypothetical protein
MSKKKKSKHPEIHPSFPPQGAEQPSHMGSQSQAPPGVGQAEPQQNVSEMSGVGEQPYGA